jgi:hypothetical protein
VVLPDKLPTASSDDPSSSPPLPEGRNSAPSASAWADRQAEGSSNLPPSRTRFAIALQLGRCHPQLVHHPESGTENLAR